MIALLLLAVLVLVLLNAFFVAAEFALVRSRKAHLQTDADEGKRGAATAVDMMDDLSRYLSAAQVGITLTSLGLDRRLGRSRVPDHHVDPHHAGRAGPEDLRDPEGRARRAPGGPPAVHLH